MSPTETAIIAIMTTQRAITETSISQYSWVSLFLALCVVVALSDNDTQILSAVCVAISLLVPIIIPVLVLARICVQLHTLLRTNNTTAHIPFESMYPDKPDSPDESPSYKICF